MKKDIIHGGLLEGDEESRESGIAIIIDLRSAQESVGEGK